MEKYNLFRQKSIKCNIIIGHNMKIITGLSSRVLTFYCMEKRIKITTLKYIEEVHQLRGIHHR